MEVVGSSLVSLAEDEEVAESPELEETRASQGEQVTSILSSFGCSGTDGTWHQTWPPYRSGEIRSHPSSTFPNLKKKPASSQPPEQPVGQPTKPGHALLGSQMGAETFCAMRELHRFV